MNKEENNFEEFIRTQLEQHTVEVSDSVWAKIEQKQKKREFIVWFKQYLNLFIALDILLLSGFTAFTMLQSSEVQSQNKLAFTQKVEPTSNDSKKTSSNERIDAINGNTNESKPLEEITKKPSDKIKQTSTNLKNSNSIYKKNETEKRIGVTETKHYTRASVSSDKKLQIKSTTLEAVVAEKALKVLLEIPEFSILPTITKLVQSKENDLQNDIEGDKLDPEFLPPTILLSKSKSVLKTEQKNKAKNEKLEQEISKASQSNKSEPTKNKELAKTSSLPEAAATEVAETNSNNNEIAPVAFDTVYGKKKFNGYVAIDALFSPEIVGRNLKGATPEVNNYITRRDSAENMRLAYSALMRVNLFINRNIFFHTGLSYSQRREKFSIIHKWQTHEDYIDSSKFVTYIDPFAGNVIYKTYDTLDYVRTHKDTLHHNLVMSFVNIPAMLGYKWLGRRSGIAVQGGVIFNMLFQQKGTMANFNYTANDVKTNSQQAFKSKAGLSLAAAISSNFKLSEKLDLIIEPHTNYMLKSLNTASYPLQQKIFSYGLNVGLRLKL
jgi:hypothetical protein